MESFVANIISSGKAGIDLAIYVLLPITVVIGGFMKVAENKGILGWFSHKVSPIVGVFGLPGLSVIAAIKLLFVSSVAPIPSLAKLDQAEPNRRKVAAAMAMIFTMTQGNVSFPLVAYGLNIEVLLVSSLLGGLAAAAFTYFILTRHLAVTDLDRQVVPLDGAKREQKTVVQSLGEGGTEGMKIAISMVPMLIISLFFLGVLKQYGVIEYVTQISSPLFALIGLSEGAVLPIITKFIGGGTAFMGVMIDQLETGALTSRDMNLIVGFVSNPLDMVGLAIFAAIGVRLGSVVKYAAYGAILGMLVRALIHFAVFN